MKTIVWEPMTDGIYGVFNSLEEAKAKYIITDNDYFEERDGILWVALCDDQEVDKMAITAKTLLQKYSETAEEYKERVLETFYSMAVWDFIPWEVYTEFISAVETAREGA